MELSFKDRGADVRDRRKVGRYAGIARGTNTGVCRAYGAENDYFLDFFFAGGAGLGFPLAPDLATMAAVCLS